MRRNNWFILSEESTEVQGHGAVQVEITLKSNWYWQ